MGEGDPSAWNGKRRRAMSNGERRILVLGQSSTLVEGVSDLLQLDGYQVVRSSNWAETEHSAERSLPNLVIVDMSEATSDTYHLSERIRNSPRWSKVPLLFVSFSGDDDIRELQIRNRHNHDGRLHFYAHTLLGIDDLLDKVEDCMT
jgi:CheY-like chemotaxis protein